MIKIGIDLSTTNTGICVLRDNELLEINVISLPKFEWTKIHYYRAKRLIAHEISNIGEMLTQNGYFTNETIVGIELANFKDPQLTQRFSFLMGIIVSELLVFLNVSDIKVFNSNAWQMKIGCTNKMERQERKEQAKQFAKQHCDKYNESWSEDMCDAYCIAYFLQEITSHQENINKIHQEHQKKQRIKQLKKSLEKLSVKAPNKEKLLSNKNYIKWSQELERLKNEK